MRTLTALVLLLAAACGGGGGDSCDVPDGTYVIGGRDPLLLNERFLVEDGLASFDCDEAGQVAGAPASPCGGVITCTIVDPAGPDIELVGNLMMDEVSDTAPLGMAQLCLDGTCATPEPVTRGM